MPATVDKGPSEVEHEEEEIELFYRNPVDLIAELIGNPDFNHPDVMAYEGYEAYSGPNEDDLSREYGEAWTGEWWGRVQVSDMFIIALLRPTAGRV